ncbi:MAG: YHS domain-containing protein [Phycisphaerales bacterium]
MTSPNEPETDPVCGMAMTPGSEAERIEHEGVTHLFCSKQCADKFRSDPERYLSSGDPDADATDHSCCSHKQPGHPSHANDGHADAIYTRPMHPEVLQVGPGDCPKCGMAIEPLDARVEQDDTELLDMRRRFWVSTAFTLPLLI